MLEWVAISFSKGSSWPRGQTWVSYIAGKFFALWAIGKSLKIVNFAFTFKSIIQIELIFIYDVWRSALFKHFHCFIIPTIFSCCISLDIWLFKLLISSLSLTAYTELVVYDLRNINLIFRFVKFVSKTKVC